MVGDLQRCAGLRSQSRSLFPASRHDVGETGVQELCHQVSACQQHLRKLFNNRCTAIMQRFSLSSGILQKARCLSVLFLRFAAQVVLPARAMSFDCCLEVHVVFRLPVRFLFHDSWWIIVCVRLPTPIGQKGSSC